MKSFKIYNKNEKRKDKTKKKVKIKLDIDTQRKDFKKDKMGLKLLLKNNLTSKSEKKKNKKKKFLNDTISSKSHPNNNVKELFTSQSNKIKKIKKNKINKNKSFISETKSYNSESKNSDKSSSNLETKSKTKKRLIKFNNIENEFNKDYSILISKKEDNMNEMNYKDMIQNDKRTYLRMYWSFFVYSKINIGTFCTENNLHLFVIKLSFYIFTFEITLFLNALFYSDEYISNAYHNNGILDFVSGLPKSIYSTLVSYIITTLLENLSNNENEFFKITKENNKDKNYENIINKKLKKLRNKLIIYYILVFLLSLIFLYYISAFCSVYRYSQKYLFLGFLESFIFDFLLSIFVCLFISFFRYKSIQNKNKCCHKLSKLIKFLL